jgi:hypothetical protein
MWGIAPRLRNDVRLQANARTVPQTPQHEQETGFGNNDFRFGSSAPFASLKATVWETAYSRRHGEEADRLSAAKSGHATTLKSAHLTDNNGYLILSTIFENLPWKSRSIFSTSFVLKPSSTISR